MDDQPDPTDPGAKELGRRLEAYADLRLSPSTAATTRTRTAVMNAAHRRAALMEADATFDAAGATWAARARAQTPRTRRTAWQTWRRPLAAILAGCLTLALLGGTAIAARPGGPLYAARIWTEMVSLPAEVMARAEAEVRRLQARIDEAQSASSAGDGPATEAALAAYSIIVIEAASSSRGDAGASATIEIHVERHVVVLTAMVEQVPAPARAAVENALVQSDKALKHLGGGEGSLVGREGSLVGREASLVRLGKPGT